MNHPCRTHWMAIAFVAAITMLALPLGIAVAGDADGSQADDHQMDPSGVLPAQAMGLLPDRSTLQRPLADLGPGVDPLRPIGQPPKPLISTDDHMVNPADEANKSKRDDDDEGVEGSGGGHVPTYRLPPVTVEGQKPSSLREEERIGSYNQPRWTAHRRFPSTRIYVRPEGEIELEWWSRTKVKRETGETEQIHEFEVEFGLPLRFQLDLYLVTKKTNRGPYEVDQAVELRWAIADWGVIPLNPTLYFEYKLSGLFELKVLLGDEIAEGLHFGVNLVWEQGVYDERETVLEITGGLSYTLLDEEISIGIEFKFEVASVHSNRDFWEENLRIGPTIQLHPLEAMHIDIAPLFGITARSRLLDMFIVVGWEF